MNILEMGILLEEIGEGLQELVTALPAWRYRPDLYTMVEEGLGIIIQHIVDTMPPVLDC